VDVQLAPEDMKDVKSILSSSSSDDSASDDGMKFGTRKVSNQSLKKKLKIMKEKERVS